VAEDGSRQVPVMIHRAILGSLERFIGILIEHFGGLLPAWLAPVQVLVLNITDRQASYSERVKKVLLDHGIRAEADLRNEKIGFKIREHTLARVPFLLVIGDRELESEQVAVRDRSGRDFGTMAVTEFARRLRREVDSYGRLLFQED
jgi:threonyl-tRNA synthetase